MHINGLDQHLNVNTAQKIGEVSRVDLQMYEQVEDIHNNSRVSTGLQKQLHDSCRITRSSPGIWTQSITIYVRQLQSLYTHI
jgi:hypothetical protein